MALAIFDLDNTLLAGDSDYLWGQFLVDKGVVDKAYYEEQNKHYYEAYKAGNLDIYAFLRFSLKPLKENDISLLLEWRDIFIESQIRALVLPKALELVMSHRKKNDFLMIITATNKFVTEPIAEIFGVDLLLATEPEMIDGQYTGEVYGIPCFKEGKVKRLDAWLKSSGHTLEDSYFYSDSHNDLPLLEKVTFPVAVDADDILYKVAKEKSWPITSLR